MSVSFPSGFQNLGKGSAFPVCDGGLIPFAGATTGLLRRPLQSLSQKAANVIVMERDAEVSTDDFGNALRGPELIGPAVGLGTLAEQLLELVLLFDGQARRRARMWLGREAVGLFGT